jgi:hypothetical protein
MFLTNGAQLVNNTSTWSMLVVEIGNIYIPTLMLMKEPSHLA